jgi:structural maintenance of chromosome 4
MRSVCLLLFCSSMMCCELRCVPLSLLFLLAHSCFDDGVCVVGVACGELKSHHVVSDTATAQAAVQYLKQHDLGVASFILLDKLEDFTSRMKPLQTPEGVPRLFDLVRPKHADLSRAFYFALRDTLVAQDLTQAIRVAESGGRKWRVVTLDGKLIEAVGTMSGGGNAVMRGGMSSKLESGPVMDEKELSALEAQCQALEQKLTQTRSQRTALQSQLTDTSKRLSAAQTAVKTLTLEVQALSDSIQRLTTQRLPALQAAVSAATSKEVQSKTQELLAERKAAEAELHKATKATEALQSAVDALQAKLMAAGGAKLQTLQAKVDELDAAIDRASTDIQKAKVLQDTNSKKCKKLQSAIESTAQELEECAERLKELSEEQTAIEAGAGEVAQAFEQADARQKQKFAELSVIQKAYDAIKKEIGKIKYVLCVLCCVRLGVWCRVEF